MPLPGRRGALLLVLLAVAIVLPPYFGTYYTRFATQIAIYGMAALSVDLLLGYTGLITFGQAALFGVGAYAAGMLTVYWRYQCTGGMAARHPGVDAVRPGDRKSLAADARLPVHHGDPRLRADGLLLRPEPAQLGRRRRLHRAATQSSGLHFARRSRDVLLRRARATGARGLYRQPDRRIGVRNGDPRYSRQRAARGRDRLPALSVQTGHLRHCRWHSGTRRRAYGQPREIRQSGDAELAVVRANCSPWSFWARPIR